jgi:hypothetical protein
MEKSKNSVILMILVLIFVAGYFTLQRYKC